MTNIGKNVMRLLLVASLLISVSCRWDSAVRAPTSTPRLVISPLNATSEPWTVRAVQGRAMDVRFIATGGDGNYDWRVSQGALPAGVALTTTGVLSGPPADSGSREVTVTVSSAGQVESVPVTLVVAIPLQIVTKSLPSATTSGSYSAKLEATSRSSALRWTVVSGRVPLGLSLDAIGLLSGVPLSGGSTTFTVEVTDGLQIARRELTLVVSPSNPTLAVGVVTNVGSDGRRVRAILLPANGSPHDTALYVAVSADLASDSASIASVAGVSLRLMPQDNKTVTDTLAAYRRVLYPTTTFSVPFQAPMKPVSDSIRFCGSFGAGNSCSNAVLRVKSDWFAFYDDVSLPASERMSDAWYARMLYYNAQHNAINQRIWGLPSDVDGNGRINVVMTNKIGTGFMWLAPCVGPGPVNTGRTDCYGTGQQEIFFAGLYGAVTNQTGVEASAAHFALYLTTDAQEYIMWTQGTRFAGYDLDEGVWAFPLYSRHSANAFSLDNDLGNGASTLTVSIVTGATDQIPAGPYIGGYFQGDAWKFSCLSRLRSCSLFKDTYRTPGMFFYWLWQHLGDGIGDRYTRARFGNYFGDIWQNATGIRGAYWFNMFFLSTLLDETQIGRASELEFPENHVPEKLPKVRSEMYQLKLGEQGAYFGAYGAPQVVQISGIKPGVAYQLDVEYLSSTPTAITIVRP